MPAVIPDLSEIFEEAFERAGLEMRSGYDLRTVRRSLNMLVLEWQNRGLNLFTVEEGVLSITAGTETYVMPVDTIDLIEHQLRTGTGADQTDTRLTRISVSTYAKQSKKTLLARPTQIYVNRQPGEVNVTLWPVPDKDYELAYYRLRAIGGSDGGIAGSADVPPRFIPALVAGLAFHIAMKRPEAAMRAPALNEEYQMQFRMAADGDEDRSTWSLVPDGGY